MEEAAQDTGSFLEAAARGDVEDILRHLRTDPELINIQHAESGDTALIAAAARDHSQAIALLLDHGADVTLYNANNQSAIHVACDAIRPQLLSAASQTRFPQLGLAQAAWQGNMEIIQHLLSTEHCQYVNTGNSQGATPVMLVVRGVDLFEGLAMETEYRPLSVLEELLKHDADTQILDPNGKSALNYASESQSPLRGQLEAALQKPPPHSETQDGAFCHTEPPLSDTPLSRADVPSTPCSGDPGKELSRGGVHADDESQDLEPGTELRTITDTEGEIASTHVIETVDTMYGNKINPLPHHWLTDPCQEPKTPQPARKRFPSLPPLHLKEDGNVAHLESLGLGYLIEGSRSEHDVSEPHSGADPLRNIRYIKDAIRQRLGSAESSRDSQTYPPLSRSPRCTSVRLRPLSSRSTPRSTEISISNVALFSDPLTKPMTEGKPAGLSILNTSDNSQELALSKDQVQISLDHFSPRPSYSITNDISSRSIRTGSGRGDAEVEFTTKIGSIGDLVAIQYDCEQIKRPPPCDREEHWSGPNDDTEHEKHDGDIIGTPDPINENAKNKMESAKGDIATLPKQGTVPLVHITFSKQEEIKREREHVFAIRKTNMASLPHNVSHSFNIHAQKENKKTKKTKKTRSMSASDCATKPQRPLSISNRPNGKMAPLPALVFSSVPLPSKVSKKKLATSEPSSIDRSRRSQTQSSLYTSKGSKSAISTPTPPRAKTSLDFQELDYSDMFAVIKPEESGPVISQMFPTAVYNTPSKTSREANSAPSRGSSSKSRASSSRESSARSSKRPNSRTKKSSATTSSHRRRNSAAKPPSKEDDKKGTEKSVISATDQEVETKQNVASDDEKEVEDPNPHNFSCLSIIKEATIENSLTMTRSTHTVLIEMLKELEESSKNIASNTTKLSDHAVPPEFNETEGIQQNTSPINSNKNLDGFDDQDPKTGNQIQSSKACETVKPSETDPLTQREAALTTNENFWREIFNNSVNDINEGLKYSFLQTPDRIDSYVDSERLTDELISHLEKNLRDNDEDEDEELSDIKTLKSQSYDNQQNDEDHHNQASSLNESSRSLSVKTSNIQSTLTEKHSDRSHKDSSIFWIKGEELGRGAYGTVYRGLTSQGELIAAKQVTLHVSDPAVAEKEYKKLQEEVDLLKTLKHVNIVGYLGTCLEDTMVTIFMEFVPGGSISSILKHFGPLQEGVIRKYTNHILQGTAYLHQNRVVHRDIKGNNVMLMPNGVIKLIDFGCAKRLNGMSMNGTQWEMLKSMHGTPYWMAPEVICESGHGEKSDIWSIGCTVFEMATGKPPLAHMHKVAAMFYIGKKDGLMPTLPGHFSKRARNFVDLCLTRDQKERPYADELLQHPFIRQKP